MVCAVFPGQQLREYCKLIWIMFTREILLSIFQFSQIFLYNLKQNNEISLMNLIHLLLAQEF